MTHFTFSQRTSIFCLYCALSIALFICTNLPVPPLEFLRCPRLTLFIFNSSITLVLSISFLQAIPPSLAANCTCQGCSVWRSPAHRVMRSKDTMRPCTVPPALVQLSSWASRGQLCDVRKSQQAHTHTHTLREKQAFSWVLAVTAEGPALRFGSGAPFLKPLHKSYL